MGEFLNATPGVSSLCLMVSVLCCSMRYFDQAAVFTEACLEYGLIQKNSQTCILLLLPLHVYSSEHNFCEKQMHILIE